MIVINILVDGVIKPHSVYDTNSKLTQSIVTGLKIPTGNYNDILLNFYFISPKPKEGLHLFGVFESQTSKKIEMEIANFEYEGETFENSCFIPHEVLDAEGKVELGIYGYKMNGEELEKIISLIPIEFNVVKGSYDPDTAETVIPTPTVFEIYFDKINKATTELETFKSEIETLKENTETEIKELQSNLENEIEKNIEGKINYYRKHESVYTTIAENETVIPVNIDVLNEASILFVKINGLTLIQGTDYSIDYTNKNITLTKALEKIGTTIHFICLKSIVANEADYDQLKGAAGVAGSDGQGVPTGGTTGQVLVKKSDTDYDTEWKDISTSSGTEVEIVDNLETADATKALSANQGYILNQAVTIEDFIDKVTFTEEANTSVCIFKKIGKMIVINYMGALTTHAKNDVLCTLPAGYRPKVRFWVPFVKNADAYGTLFVGTDGTISINGISSTSTTGRIYSQIIFFID